MNKQEVKQKYAELSNKLGRKATRREFTKLVGVSRRFIDKLFGNFNNLKNDQIKEIVEDKPVQMQGKNLESVLDACGVDREKWEVNEHNIKELSSGDFLFTVYFKKKKPEPIDIVAFLKEIANFIPNTPKIDYVEGELLAEVNIADLHLAKLCHVAETGNNYDIKIASKIFREAIDYKIEQLKKYKISKIFFVIGNDFYHFDNYETTTTAGTKQDADTRLPKMFQEGTKLIIEAISKFQNIAPVQGIIIGGNHGSVLEFCLGEVISAYFHNNPNVTIDNEPLPRKYYRYGKNLIGYLHGDQVKFNQLPLLMSTEARKEWGETSYHYIRTGHFHHQKIILEEMTSCVVEVLPSLSGVDGWHKKKGFCNNLRSAQTALYDKEKGLVTKIYFNL